MSKERTTSTAMREAEAGARQGRTAKETEEAMRAADREWRTVPNGPFTATLMGKARRPHEPYRQWYNIEVPFDPIFTTLRSGGEIRFHVRQHGAPEEGITCTIPHSWEAGDEVIHFELLLQATDTAERTVNIAYALHRSSVEESEGIEDDTPVWEEVRRAESQGAAGLRWAEEASSQWAKATALKEAARCAEAKEGQHAEKRAAAMAEAEWIAARARQCAGELAHSMTEWALAQPQHRAARHGNAAGERATAQEGIETRQFEPSARVVSFLGELGEADALGKRHMTPSLQLDDAGPERRRRVGGGARSSSSGCSAKRTGATQQRRRMPPRGGVAMKLSRRDRRRNGGA